MVPGSRPSARKRHPEAEPKGFFVFFCYSLAFSGMLWIMPGLLLTGNLPWRLLPSRPRDRTARQGSYPLKPLLARQVLRRCFSTRPENTKRKHCHAHRQLRRGDSYASPKRKTPLMAALRGQHLVSTRVVKDPVGVAAVAVLMKWLKKHRWSNRLL